MTKYALIKDGQLLYITEQPTTKQVYFTDSEYQKILDAEPQFLTPEEAAEYVAPSNIKTPGIDYDEEIAFDFEGDPMYIDGKVIENPAYKQQKKQAILDELAAIKSDIDALTLIGEDTKDLEARAAELKTQYKALK